MRALIALSAAALLVSACETAFVGRPPGGRYALAEAGGRALPADHGAAAGGADCRVLLHGGWFDLDQLARRWEMRLQQRNSCTGAELPEVREAGTYLRRHGRLRLEATGPEGEIRRWNAGESGRTISLDHGGQRLVFRQAAPPPR